MRRHVAAAALLVGAAACGSAPTTISATEKASARKEAADAEQFRADAQMEIDDATRAVEEAERVVAEQQARAAAEAAVEARRRAAVAAAARAARSRTTARPRPAVPAGGDIFDALARCESGADPHKNTGNGFYGAFQFTLGTWHSIGMSGNPVDYDYGTQKAAAQRLVTRSGWGQFPYCSRKIGAR